MIQVNGDLEFIRFIRYQFKLMEIEVCVSTLLSVVFPVLVLRMGWDFGSDCTSS